MSTSIYVVYEVYKVIVYTFFFLQLDSQVIAENFMLDYYNSIFVYQVFSLSLSLPLCI